MDNLAPANLDAGEIPEGFTAADPNATGGAASQQNNAEAQGKEEQKQAVLQQALTPDALARLRRIKLVKADKATKVENQIVAMAMQGKLPGVINEGKLIEMLERIGMSQSRQTTTKISIQRKKNAFDDSDEDDNDDDLL